MWIGFQDDWGFRWGRDRAALLDDAARAGATVVRTTVYWSRVAPRRPARPAQPFDPAYRLADLDELVRGAERRGMEVLLTIWGTPAWANGGAGENRMPRDVADLRAFARALADRYSGRHPGYPFVRFYSIWNEPNLAQFLSPQFGPDGRSLAPELYGRLFRAAAAGIRSVNPDAVIAAGETSHRGIDGPARSGFQASHSPARFAELVSRLRPRLEFDAWAHHPYPVDPTRSPAGQGTWPDVSIPQLPRFEEQLAVWFGRPVPLWVSEFGYQARPAAEAGVPPSAQAANLRWTLNALRADPNVQMFVWFVLRDRSNVPWKGGLENERGAARPGFSAFAAAARAVDPRNAVAGVRTERPDPHVTVPVRRLGWYDAPGAPIGVSYSIYRAGRLVARAQPQVPLLRDGTIDVPLWFWPVAGLRYSLVLRAEDEHGNVVNARLELVPLGNGGPPPWQPRDPVGCPLVDAVVPTC
jgi:hypothetical protein